MKKLVAFTATAPVYFAFVKVVNLLVYFVLQQVESRDYRIRW